MSSLFLLSAKLSHSHDPLPIRLRCQVVFCLASSSRSPVGSSSHGGAFGPLRDSCSSRSSAQTLRSFSKAAFLMATIGLKFSGSVLLLGVNRVVFPISESSPDSFNCDFPRFWIGDPLGFSHCGDGGVFPWTLRVEVFSAYSHNLGESTHFGGSFPVGLYPDYCTFRLRLQAISWISFYGLPATT